MPTMIPFEGELNSPGAPSGPNIQLLPDNFTIEPPKPASKRTLTDELERQLGRTFRMGVQGVTGTAQILGNAATGVANMGLEGLNKVAESGGHPGKLKPIPFPSKTLEGLMDRAKLGKDETPLDSVTSFLGSSLAGAGDPLIRAGQQAVNAALPAPQKLYPGPSAKALVTQELHDTGYKLPPNRFEGSTGPSRGLQAVAGSSNVERSQQVLNQPITQRLAAKDLGLPEGTDLTAPALRNVREQAAQLGYEPLKQLPPLGIGGKFRQDLANLVMKYGGSQSFAGRGPDPIRSEVNRFLLDPQTGRYRQTFTPEDALTEIRNLRAQASDNFKPGGDTRLAHVQQGIAKALEDNIELNLSQSRYAGTPFLQRFKDARQLIAKSHDVEDMLVDPATGIVSPQKAAGLLAQGRPLSGNLLTIAKAGSPVFGGSTRAPVAGEALPVTIGGADAGMGIGAMTGMMGAAMGHPGIGAGVGGAIAAMPAVRFGARSLINSSHYQNKLAENMMSGPGFLMTPAGQRAYAASLLGLSFPMLP